jgi:phosphonate transport system substrate-binding protein
LLNGVGLEVLVVPVIDGAPLYRVACVVQQDSPATRLYELGGAVFAVTDPLSFSGRAFMQRRLRDLGTSPEEFFSSTVQVEGHDAALQLVANGTVDGACVNQMVLDDMVRDNPALAAQLRMIEQSDAFGAPPVVVNQDIEPQLKLRLADAFIQMAADTAGRVVLDGLGIDGFEVPPAGLYDDLERFLSRSVTEERPR